MKIKKLMALSLAAITASSVMGSLAAAEPVEITFPTFFVGVSVYAEWFSERLEAFNAEYGDEIKVNVEEIAGDQAYVDKMKVLYSSNSLPDVICTGG